MHLLIYLCKTFTLCPIVYMAWKWYAHWGLFSPSVFNFIPNKSAFIMYCTARLFSFILSAYSSNWFSPLCILFKILVCSGQSLWVLVHIETIKYDCQLNFNQTISSFLDHTTITQTGIQYTHSFTKGYCSGDLFVWVVKLINPCPANHNLFPFSLYIFWFRLF